MTGKSFPKINVSRLLRVMKHFRHMPHGIYNCQQYSSISSSRLVSFAGEAVGMEAARHWIGEGAPLPHCSQLIGYDTAYNKQVYNFHFKIVI